MARFITCHTRGPIRREANVLASVGLQVPDDVDKTRAKACAHDGIEFTKS